MFVILNIANWPASYWDIKLIDDVENSILKFVSLMALACKSILAYWNACCLRFVQFKFQSLLGHVLVY